MAFTSQGGDLKNIFITEACIIDRFVGNQLWTWGYNNSGVLAINNAAVSGSTSSPVQTVSGGTNWNSVTIGGFLGVATKTDGTLWAWGGSYVGDNTGTLRSSPVQTISGGTNWKSASVNSHFAAIKTDGTLWLWGSGFNGRLGNNSTTGASSPVQTVAGGTNWRDVCVGCGLTIATKTDGTLWMWGSSASSGQLGNNVTTPQSSPVQTVAGGTNWKCISTSYSQSAATKTDGTLWLWGCNNSGQLGNNATTARSSPVQTVSGGTNWKQVSVGSYASSAIKTDGSLWTWGCNYLGILGNNSTVSQSSPVQTVAGGTNWKQVQTKGSLIGAVKTDGTLWMWGMGRCRFGGCIGGIGNNSNAHQSSPVQTIAGGTNWKCVSTGYAQTAAITFTS